MPYNKRLYNNNRSGESHRGPRESVKREKKSTSQATRPVLGQTSYGVKHRTTRANRTAKCSCQSNNAAPEKRPRWNKQRTFRARERQGAVVPTRYRHAWFRRRSGGATLWRGRSFFV